MNSTPDLAGLRFAAPDAGRLPAIVHLLTAAGLPAGDLDADRLATFEIALDADDGLAGVAGLDILGHDGLLRSLAVAPAWHGRGLGRLLVARREAAARAAGLDALYLLTTGADAFFRRLGYQDVARGAVPAAVSQHPQFRGLCPASAKCLGKAVARPDALKGKVMKKLEVFDPAMCCSTGVCGVDVDPVLVQFAADLKWLADQGVTVERHNLSQEPQAFAANSAVLKEMEAGMDRLPVLLVDGHVVATGTYPSRAQLAQKLGVALTDAEAPRAKTGCCSAKSGGC